MGTSSGTASVSFQFLFLRLRVLLPVSSARPWESSHVTSGCGASPGPPLPQPGRRLADGRGGACGFRAWTPAPIPSRQRLAAHSSPGCALRAAGAKAGRKDGLRRGGSRALLTSLCRPGSRAPTWDRWGGKSRQKATRGLPFREGGTDCG